MEAKPDREQSGYDEIGAKLQELHSASYAWAVHCCGGDRAEAEDLLQSVYLKLLEGHARFEGRSSFKTWLFTVIRNSAMDTKRRIFRRLRALDHLFSARSVEAAATQDELVESGEMRSRLGVMLEGLSACQREVLRLVFYHDLSIEQASEVMKISVGSARVHYERGKANLRKEMRKLEVDYVHGPGRKANQRAF